MFECYLSMYGTVPWYHRFFSKQRTPFCSHDVNFMNQHIPKQLPHIEIMIICIPTGGEPFFANFVVRGCQESAGRRIVFTTFWIPSMQQRRLEEDQEAFLRCPQFGQGPKYPQNLLQWVVLHPNWIICKIACMSCSQMIQEPRLERPSATIR